MPPKQQTKTNLAKKQKIIEDKTFGLKNKNKSKNVQKYVQFLKQNVQPQPDSSNSPPSQPKVPNGVDPKSIVCEFFKVGQCTKGFKCKFSHNLNVQRKGEKIDIYSDKRDQGAVAHRHESDPMKDMFQRILVCKYFLEAVEKKHYGWFWVCPNGGKDCHYRHSLPLGYVLKSQMKALLDEEAEKISIEEEIENQCAKTTASTPMTPELFMQWKKKRMEKIDAGLASQRAERAKNDRMSGRELFLSDATMFVDDKEAYEKYQREEEPDGTE
ncbi:hypothetical protein POTOM_060973 [Populus tomentosa]|uniref:C3H1-type domain-containing protein n=1 Tax=Populus tomentosa TaxID=118781 RepID=A0A8X8C1K0_POPTO|nr:hypothetical protein POTOM_060973 [Populus tomentosa]